MMDELKPCLDELKPCPFCGGTNITMGAYSIAPECHIECECGAGIELIVNFDAEMSVEEHDDLCAMELAMAWNRRAGLSNNPLTLEELRGMRGEPVYVVKGKCQWWDIVDFIAGGWLYLRIANKTDLALDDYGTKWLAYRRKPEVQDG